MDNKRKTDFNEFISFITSKFFLNFILSILFLYVILFIGFMLIIHTVKNNNVSANKEETTIIHNFDKPIKLIDAINNHKNRHYQ